MRRAPLVQKLWLASLLFATVIGWARDKQELWTQVRTPHFTIVCQGHEKQARKIADQLERMRLVFHTSFPQLQIDPGSPIIVIAVKDEKAFRALEPEAYLAKGQLHLAGLFMRAPDKNYVLLRMDAPGEHPYATIYHEYTHLLVGKLEWMPLWLNEGMAEFYQNSNINEKDVTLGEPSPDDIMWLRQNRLLPLATLFAVDYKSPYYHEEHKGSIFYSESWALTHYLTLSDLENKTDRITDYATLVANHVDPVTAATRAFGDLKQLQSALDKYIEQSRFKSFKLLRPLPVQDTAFKVESITPVQADAMRADFLAYNQREKDSRSLLAEVLHDDPNNTLAHETMGYLEFRIGHLQEAEHWYEQAVKLDSQSYLANYYFGAIAMNLGQSGPEIDDRIESSLQKAIKLNPSFAPSYERLAVFYGMRHKNLRQAHLLMLQAVQLEPSNLQFRINTANVLLNMGRQTDAIAVLQNALKLAKTPQEIMAVQNQLTMLQTFAQREEQPRPPQEATVSSEASQVQDVKAVSQESKEDLTGPHLSIVGTVRNVRCSYPTLLDVDVDSGGKTITLHARNFYSVKFSSLDYTPTSEFHPCSDLEGRHAKVDYIEGAPPKANMLVGIELHK